MYLTQLYHYHTCALLAADCGSASYKILECADDLFRCLVEGLEKQDEIDAAVLKQKQQSSSVPNPTISVRGKPPLWDKVNTETAAALDLKRQQDDAEAIALQKAQMGQIDWEPIEGNIHHFEIESVDDA
jgi:hypothetical protein